MCPRPFARHREVRWLVCAAAFVLTPLAAVAESSSSSAPSARGFDLAALARQSKTVEIAEERLRAAFVKGAPEGVLFSSTLDLGDGRAAVAWSECSRIACRGSVATLIGGTVWPKLTKKAPLVAPEKVFFSDGFAFEAPALADLDGDGTPEIVLHYRASEPPRAALGSLSHEYVAVYSPKDLSLLFSHELARTGGDSENACHWTLDRGGDRLIVSGQCNVRSCLESAPPPAGCKPNRKYFETWRKARIQRRYLRVASSMDTIRHGEKGRASAR